MRTKKTAAIVAGALAVTLALPAAAFAAPQSELVGRFASCQAARIGSFFAQSQCLFSETCMRGFADADGDGVCDAYGMRAEGRPGYVDANNDGVCDNYGSGACGRGHVDHGKAGSGEPYGHGRGCMQGSGQNRAR